MNDPAAGVDLANCEREPIHIPGSIQPHGLLFALTEPELRVAAVGANTGALLGRPPEDCVGGFLGGLIGDEGAARIAALLGGAGAPSPEPVDLAAGGAAWLGTVHRHDGLAFLELETPLPGAPPKRLPQVSAATRRLQAAQGIAEACTLAAEEVRRITLYDRVMIYRFAEDWSGEVIGEARADGVDSYLGLHYPASDIPAQARALYARNPVRLIPDVGYQPAPLFPDLNPLTGRPLDLSFAVLRSVSPVHLEYLRNMGVGSSMSVSVMRGQRLWGLIACHHRTAHHVPADARQAAELVGQVLAWQLATMDRVEGIRHSVQVKALQGAILGRAGEGRDPEDGLVEHGPALLGLMDATGFALVSPGRIVRAGTTPGDEALKAIARWRLAEDGAEVFATDRLPALLPALAPETAIASGLLAVRLAQRSFLLWLRPELVRTVTWGGDPRKPVAEDEGRRLHPRKSFAAWSEEVRGRSAPWETQHRAAALELRDRLLEVVVRRRDELQRQNTQLVRSNDDLETFIYVASHDLREPLRQIEMLAGLIKAGVHDGYGVGEPVELIGEATRRLRGLIGDLAAFSRAGRGAERLAPVDMAALAREVVRDLGPEIERAGARIDIGALPTALGDRPQLRQVLVNLVENALKYRHPDRVPAIRLSGEVEAAAPDDPLAGGAEPRARIAVADNGIGFAPEHGAHIFEAFQRLHTSEAYEGSGMGLAICRRIVQRHGGEMAAEGRPGAGATFTFTLPAA